MDALKRRARSLAQVKITLLLIVLNIMMYAIAWRYDVRRTDSLSLAETSFLIDWGGNVSALVFSGEYWRLLSSQFLHAGRLHLLMNMLALWSIGLVLEKKLPALIYLMIYLLSGMAGGLLSAVYYASSATPIVSCGASGSIFGLAGVLIAYALVTRNTHGLPIKNLLFSLALTFGSGLFLPLDNLTHFGGLLFGFVAGGVVTLTLTVWQPTCSHRMAVYTLLLIGPLAVMSAVFVWQTIPGGKGQVAAAKIILILENLGYGDLAAKTSGIAQLDECIDEQTRAEPADYQRCSGIDLGYVAMSSMARKLSRDVTHCLALSQSLAQLYHDKEDKRKIGVVKTWCEQHKTLYDVVFGNSSAVIDSEKLNASTARMRRLSDNIHFLNVQTSVSAYSSWGNLSTLAEEEDREDIRELGVFNDVTSRIYKTVRAGQCPYYNCTKP